MNPTPAGKSRVRLGASSRVALGILVSRLTGLIRERFIAHYLGSSAVADAFAAAIRIPNVLNTLLGEGVLSASFITVYAKLRALKQDREAETLADAVFGVLSLVCSVLVLLGILLAPYLIDFIAPGFDPAERELTTRIVRILFPATGLLVMSAWCLGVLNSHRRFLLSYMAPVALNAAVIAALIAFGGSSTQEQLVIDVAFAYIVGGALQFLVQLPRVLSLLPRFRPILETHSEHVRAVIRNFGPIFLSRGVVQISALVDSIIASLLPTGAVIALRYSQVISMLPISLFSMSVSAAELPALSSAVGNREEVAGVLRRRLSTGLRQIAFFVIPSAVAFLILGDVLAAGLYQSGNFGPSQAVYVWAVLAGSAVGLLATSLGRLYSSAFYALLDTKTPLRFAVIRVALTTALGFPFALEAPQWIGVNSKWGLAGLTVSAGIAGWVEFALLRRSLSQRIGSTPLPARFTLTLWSIAFIGAGISYWIKERLGTAHPISLAIVIISVYGSIYFGGTSLLGIPESKSVIVSALRRIRGK